MQIPFSAAAIVLGLALMPNSALAQNIHGGDNIKLPPPPETEKHPVTDNYFGTKVTDDYRWLEDAKSPATRAFLDAQMAYTDRYLHQAKVRPEFADALDGLVRVTTWSAPIQRTVKSGSKSEIAYFYMKRLSSEDQASIYMRRGWAPTGATLSAKSKTPAQNPEIRLVDPAKLTRDPNTSVSIADISHDGALLAYAVRQGGADEEEVHFLDVASGKTKEDVL
ncbi:MAG TPA: hypothetical protein VL346_06355, partial [Acidobacteriaceae bacterium]|nr:hypothetical protein [Acidobacteriaceae bacterium]